MAFDYNANMPSIEWLEQNAVKEIYQPERWLKRFVIISTRVCAFYESAEEHFNNYYSVFPGAKIVGMPVRGNCTTNFFIVMDKSRWDFITTMFNGDLNQFYQFLQQQEKTRK